MSELSREQVEALAEVLGGHLWASIPSPDGPCSCGELPTTVDHFGRWVQTWRGHVAAVIAPTVAAMIEEAEQRGREDNADHGMCYVHGSRALEARLAEARAEVVRDVEAACGAVISPRGQSARIILSEVRKVLARHAAAAAGAPLADERTSGGVEGPGTQQKAAEGRTEPQIVPGIETSESWSGPEVRA